MIEKKNMIPPRLAKLKKLAKVDFRCGMAMEHWGVSMILSRLFDSYCEDSHVTRLVFSIYIRRLGRFLLDIALSGLSFLLAMIGPAA